MYRVLLTGRPAVQTPDAFAAEHLLATARAGGDGGARMEVDCGLHGWTGVIGDWCAKCWLEQDDDVLPEPDPDYDGQGLC